MILSIVEKNQVFTSAAKDFSGPGYESVPSMQVVPMWLVDEVVLKDHPRSGDLS